MNEKQLANRLRDIANNAADADVELQLLADELDPPKPEQGTVVSWRFIGAWAYHGWRHGVVDKSLKGVWTSDGLVHWGQIQWKPARILGPGEVAVDCRAVKRALMMAALPNDVSDEFRALLRGVDCIDEAERTEGKQ